MNSPGQSDQNTKICDKMQEDHQCKSRCSVKSLESLESNNCGVCCKSKSSKPYCCEKQCKTVDTCSSSTDCERPRTSDTICGKLSCIIKRLDRLIDICPSQNESLNQRSATNQPGETDTNPKNGHEKPPQKTVIPVNNCEMPVKSLPETKVQPIQSKTCPVDIPSKQNSITATDDKSCCEFKSTDSCTQEEPTKPKPPPVPVKIIKSITKPITEKPKPKPVQNMMCFDQIKVKQNSKNTQLSSSEKKNINKR